MTHYVGSRGPFLNFPFLLDRRSEKLIYFFDHRSRKADSFPVPKKIFARISSRAISYVPLKRSRVILQKRINTFAQHDLSIIIIMFEISSFYITSSSAYANFQGPAYPPEWNGGLLGIHASTFGSVFRHCLLIVRGVRLAILPDTYTYSTSLWII